MTTRSGLSPAVIAPLALLLVAVTSCGTSVQIEWQNFLKVGGITYVADFASAMVLPPTLQGSQYATVRFTVADHVYELGYQTKDGDAAFLPAGTPIYQVVGYRPSFRLAAPWNGQLTIYEASDVPHAQTGADLLDIRDKVTRIGVLWNTPTPPGLREQGSIAEPTLVQNLVRAVLAAPLRTNTVYEQGTQVFIAFHLRDGTETVRVFFPAEHDLASIFVPDAFVQALQPLLPPPTPLPSATP